MATVVVYVDPGRLALVSNTRSLVREGLLLERHRLAEKFMEFQCSGSVGDLRAFEASVFGRYDETGDSRRKDGVEHPRWWKLGVFFFLWFSVRDRTVLRAFQNRAT